MSDAPERIWLQDGGDYASAHEAMLGTETGVTWCDTCVDENDTEYVRADRIEALEAENARLRGVLRVIVESYDARSELHTSDADCAANLADHASAAL